MSEVLLIDVVKGFLDSLRAIVEAADTDARVPNAWRSADRVTSDTVIAATGLLIGSTNSGGPRRRRTRCRVSVRRRRLW